MLNLATRSPIRCGDLEFVFRMNGPGSKQENADVPDDAREDWEPCSQSHSCVTVGRVKPRLN